MKYFDEPITEPLYGVLCLDCGYLALPHDVGSTDACTCSNELIVTNVSGEIDFEAMDHDRVQFVAVVPYNPALDEEWESDGRFDN